MGKIGTVAAVSARRTLVDGLDSVEQRLTWERLQQVHCSGSDGGVASAFEAELVGQIRIAHLVGGEVLLTDSMLLDSRFFTSVGPRDLAQRLGLSTTDLPLTVMCHPGPSIRSAIQRKLARGPGFTWQLRHWHPDAASWPPPAVSAAWEEWVAAEERGDIRVEPLLRDRTTGEPKPPLHLEWTPPPNPHESLADFVTTAASATARSAVVQLRDELGPTLPAEAREELRVIWDDWNSAYLDAVARQHDADWIRLRQASASSPSTGEGRRLVEVAGNFLEVAPAMPPASYAQLLFTARDERERFLADPSPQRMRALAFQVERSQATTTRASVITAAGVRLALALVAVALASPLTPNPASPNGIAWLLFGILLVVTVPWSEVATLFRLRSRSVAVLSVSSSQGG